MEKQLKEQELRRTNAVKASQENVRKEYDQLQKQIEQKEKECDDLRRKGVIEAKEIAMLRTANAELMQAFEDLKNEYEKRQG